MNEHENGSNEFAWVHDVDRIPARGLEVRRSATPEERAAIARALELAAVERIDASYAIEPRSQGRFLLSGALEADLTQTCVVTLEPVAEEIREQFRVELWPQDQIDAPAEVAFDALADDEVEPIRGGRIEVGAILFELLAAALNPYPRKQGVVFEEVASGPQQRGAEEGPFAVLGKLKRQD